MFNNVQPYSTAHRSSRWVMGYRYALAGAIDSNTDNCSDGDDRGSRPSPICLLDFFMQLLLLPNMDHSSWVMVEALSRFRGCTAAI